MREELPLEAATATAPTAITPAVHAMGCSRHVAQPLRSRAKINNSADLFIVQLRNDVDSRYCRTWERFWL
jgi:hypothetical protein